MENADSLCCAICLSSTKFAQLPCCDSPEATTKFCLECVRLMCNSMGLNGVGRCPKCRAWIAVESNTIVKREGGPCKVCCQFKVIVDRHMCDACTFGSRYPLRYECSQCSNVQRIPHPMYRYQDSPTAYSHTTWACHQECMDYTRWRVIPADVRRVPDADAPPSWNRNEAILNRVRELRAQGHQSEYASRCEIS